MDEHKSSTDFDDAEILAKFRNLLGKYQNQGKIIGVTTSTPVSTPTATSQTNGISQEVEADSIPTLTEIVILHPSVIQPQPKRSTPIRQILDAALEDAHIEMDALDRKALAHALEVRLADQVK
ncbi:MAG: hypothetical protein KA524_00620 [Nitrosomonas sp.]|nr:hypothetical protein [Nitrosomonas sp.]MBP6075144.1 hypothetical protein [Nitrosomonas sp.]